MDASAFEDANAACSLLPGPASTQLAIFSACRVADAPGAVPAFGAVAASSGIGALAWTAFKVGALSFGGGFVIVLLMQGDAVHAYYWMTDTQFLNAVALGQVTPGPVIATVAAVGYAAHRLGGGLLAAAVAFIPSFSCILLGGGRFESLRANANARAFLEGAGPVAIGAILGAAIPLDGALGETWAGGSPRRRGHRAARTPPSSRGRAASSRHCRCGRRLDWSTDALESEATPHTGRGQRFCSRRAC
jgi:chromate transport protein ChrA